MVVGKMTTSVHDVAAMVLQICGPMSAMKLQKLVYYAQAWVLASDAEYLFDEEIQAWVYGPVCPELYRAHRGQYIVSEISEGDPNRLGSRHTEIVCAVTKHYRQFDGSRLSQMTHEEEPWRTARQGLDQSERASRTISRESMRTYYARQKRPFFVS